MIKYRILDERKPLDRAEYVLKRVQDKLNDIADSGEYYRLDASKLYAELKVQAFNLAMVRQLLENLNNQGAVNESAKR